MYNENYNMNETEVLVKKQRELDLQTALMAELVAIKGNQFGKPVYSTVLPFKDLMKFLNVFPEVQRQLNSRKVTSIKTYTLSGMELMKKAKRAMRFFLALHVRQEGTFTTMIQLKRLLSTLKIVIYQLMMGSTECSV
ncbi:hypothetical protein AAAC51_07190 [Priestia megaterium]